MDSYSDFLIKPVFLHGFSGSLHLVLLILLIISWMSKKFQVNHGVSSKQSLEQTLSLYYRRASYCCLGVSAFNFVVCVFFYCYWYGNNWSDEKLATLLDLVLKILTWGTIFIYLRTQSPGSEASGLPLLLRLWWGFYLCFSCYCLAIDYLLPVKYESLQSLHFASDAFSLISGFFFCYVGLSWKKKVIKPLVEEPLLNGSSDGIESSNLKGGQRVTPYAYANVFSILTFYWMGPLIALGYKKTLDLKDVPTLADGESVGRVFPIFRNKLESDAALYSTVTTPRLVKALIFIVWKEILLTSLFALIYTLSSFVGPYILDSFVQYLSGKQKFKNEGFLLVLTFSIAKIIECLSQRHWFFLIQQAGIKARATLVATIYNKALTLSCQSKQRHTSGEIINFMAIDAERVGDFGWYMHDPWMAVLQVTLALLILYKNLGLASIAALIATILVMLVNLPLGSWLEKYQDKVMQSKDDRMKATSEVLRNMRLLKLQGWEMKFLWKIMRLRETEVGWLKKYVYTEAMISSIFWVSPMFVSVVTFGACFLLRIPLEAGKILSALATFRILQEPIYNIPDTISMIAQTKVSVDRIAAFLCLDELQPDVIYRLPRGSSEVSIEVVDGNFSWDFSSTNPTLRDINLRVHQGMRVAVCGTVGSGKSSLLSCILGEMPKISGTLMVCGTKAYVAQSPWIQSGKIEENILFGKEMERERYDSVLEACSLVTDLDILPFGDQTVIGERGINLSGGQKQRIQIARALYHDADIYILDDPFSALDAHTGSHLFKECVLRHLSQKTVIYVTHQVEFLPSADLILVMKDGKIIQAGKYNEILSSGTDFEELVSAHKNSLKAINSVESKPNLARSTSVKTESTQKEGKKDVQGDEADCISEQKGQLVQEEEREKGKVGFTIYWKYITAAYRGALVPFILVSQILIQVLQIGSNYWMAWATPVSKDIKPVVGGFKLISVYMALSLGSSFCTLVKALLLVTAGFKTANLLFDKMHLYIFRSPMSFFDSTPSGRILNRVNAL